LEVAAGLVLVSFVGFVLTATLREWRELQ
jgi:hypothetical protein